ncbi:Glycosyltransferase involved in cell wall bisynthesis [Paenibacillus sp. yr247]|uniref:glycosyltransferase family 2 protein n=1 Tax=Paenibacillus sp. yr247 TaxID=1761880 RepID=UPI00088C0554|nr:glycosyltransferase family 2 protein [Paenibacillus sp. yr247]SDN32321.1 Glycosyltransferase involved in cell wall bisynthesis [Paenibacillus sp. yr247]
MKHERKMVPVSVIIPCYKSADTVRRAVDSVWMQSVRPTEVILVEDCSPDDNKTLEILLQLESEHPQGWIKVIPLTQNGGPGHARNSGWDQATQTYVAFLDADDAWHHRKLEVQYGWMESHPEVAISAHNFKQLEANEQFIHEIDINNMKVKKVEASLLLRHNVFPTRAVMLKSDLTIRFDDTKRYSEDYLLWLQIIINKNEGWMLEECLAYTYKEDYGSSGLSSNLWLMEKGELENYDFLFKNGYISNYKLYLIKTLSIAKYIWRLCKVSLRKLI